MVAKSIALTFVAAFLVWALVLAMRPSYKGIRAGHADEDYLNSQTCVSCHTDHYASWAKTYHSRMTQEARPDSVQGDFETNNEFEYLGINARMEKREGRFYMKLAYPDGRTHTFNIERTVGSRRIEQYLTKQNDQYVRLPLAYDLVNRRWMSLNGSFFHPDNDNYFSHVAQWDNNCVFCHNVKAQPNYNWESGRFDTEVAELGIACGACHGPAAGHAEAAASPLTRTAWRLSDRDSKQIVHPLKLDSDRATMVCGHCHGQRVPEPLDRIQQIMSKGDPFNSGDDLSTYFRPVWRETTLKREGQPDFSFASRFWANGSPRLTAYEYQGLLRSRCFTHGEPGKRISCLSCHTMHGGDPKGQITEENRTNKACIGCHQQYEAPAALVEHTKHPVESVGSRCYTCHMPRVVYGIMSVHPTHDITIPDPQLTVTESVPNACNQCHLDKSVNWSIAESKRLWPDRYRAVTPGADRQFDLPEGPRALFSGDALMRALAAEALGGGGPVQPDKHWATPFLIEAFDDNYPIVRFFAANGLASGPWRLAKPDYLGTPQQRFLQANQWRELIDPSKQQTFSALVQLLRANRKDVDIEVGE